MIRYFKFSLILLCLASTSGCWNVATTGAQAVYNHKSLQKNFADQTITMQAFQALHNKTTEFANTNISISTLNREVLLAGQVPESWQKIKAEEIVKKIDDVKHIYNLITIANPSSALTRVSDTWITTKVKAKLIASNDLDATQIKVVTENGTVYLMGILLPEEAQVATDLTRETDGVLKVVKIFSYIHISKA